MKSPSERSRVRRNARRAEYDPDVIRALLDQHQLCHVAYVENGEPRVIPTLYMRQGDHLYLHGNRQSALLRHLAAGGQAALSVTSVQGVVVARSGFHCSMNYRSVVVFGRGEAVPEAQQEAILDRFVEVLIPGHLARVRKATPQELAATLAVRIPITEASAKVRTGDPIDDPADLLADAWAGVIPLRTAAGTAVPSADLKPGVDVPGYIRGYEAKS